MEVWKGEKAQFEIIVKKICECAWKIRRMWCSTESLRCLKEFDPSIESQIKWKQIDN